MNRHGGLRPCKRHKQTKIHSIIYGIDNVNRVVLKNVTFDGVEGDHIIEKNCRELIIE